MNFWVQVQWEKSSSSSVRRAIAFLRSPSKRLMVKQWLWLGHMPIPEPIAVARAMI